jgi:hypothetical protein
MLSVTRTTNCVMVGWLERNGLIWCWKNSGHTYYPNISLQELKKSQVITIKFAGILSDIWTRDPWNTMNYLFLDVNIRTVQNSTRIFKIYRMIQKIIEHQSGLDEHWRPLVAEMRRPSRNNICKNRLRVTLQFVAYSMVIWFLVTEKWIFERVIYKITLYNGYNFI